MKILRIGQIGTGCQHAGQIMRCVRSFPDSFEVVGVVDSDRKGEHPDFAGVPRLSEEQLFATPGLDAVIVEPEEHHLLETAQRCIARGFSIHMDKPGGESDAGYRELLRQAQERGLIVHMGYMYRYNPAVRYCLSMVKRGELGEITAIDSAMSTDHPLSMRQWLGTFHGGSMYIFGCHLLDLILQLQGMPDRVLSFLKKTGQEGVDVYDNDFALLEYPGGVSTVRIHSAQVNGFGLRHLVVTGSKGTLEIQPMEDPLRAYVALRRPGATPFEEKKEQLSFSVGGRYDGMMLAFARMVRGEMQNPYSYAHEAALHRLHLTACGISPDAQP